MLSKELSQLKQQNQTIVIQNNDLKEENKKINENLIKILKKLDPA